MEIKFKKPDELPEHCLEVFILMKSGEPTKGCFCDGEGWFVRGCYVGKELILGWALFPTVAQVEEELG
jgi:hypothetical protein